MTKPAAKLTKTNVSRLLSKDWHDKNCFSCSEESGSVVVQYHSGLLNRGGREMDLQPLMDTLSKYFDCSFFVAEGFDYREVQLRVTAKS